MAIAAVRLNQLVETKARILDAARDAVEELVSRGVTARWFPTGITDFAFMWASG